MTKVQVTLTKAEVTGEGQRSHKINSWWYLLKHETYRHHTKVQYKKRHLMTSAFLTLTTGQGHTTRSNFTDVEVSAFSECFLFWLWFFFLFLFSLHWILSYDIKLKYLRSLIYSCLFFRCTSLANAQSG